MKAFMYYQPRFVMLRCAQHLAAARDRPCAEFPLSEANALRVTRQTVKDSSSG
jgi:hypothetical protein